MKPTKVEARYQEELEVSAERPIEEDIYTVYLMAAPSKGMHKVSWCLTTNIQKKLKIARDEVAPDAKIIARFPIQNKARARSIAIRINEDSGTFQSSEGREIYKWAANPSYLNKFKNWDPNGLKMK